jgi:AraC-like DNA-binding protein
MYLLNIDFAQQLLSNNSLNISEVAYQIGFNDPRYFSKCFKKATGISPKDYRETLRKKSFSYGRKHCDESFLQKALVILETKISDRNISIDEFANEMNVSKASLYRKLKSTSGLSPARLMCSVKINHSVQLLTKHKNITDVAFAVGFNDSKYFSRCFKSEFGISPKQYQQLLSLSLSNN